MNITRFGDAFDDMVTAGKIDAATAVLYRSQAAAATGAGKAANAASEAASKRGEEQQKAQAVAEARASAAGSGSVNPFPYPTEPSQKQPILMYAALGLLAYMAMK